MNLTSFSYAQDMMHFSWVHIALKMTHMYMHKRSILFSRGRRNAYFLILLILIVHRKQPNMKARLTKIMSYLIPKFNGKVLIFAPSFLYFLKISHKKCHSWMVRFTLFKIALWNILFLFIAFIKCLSFYTKATKCKSTMLPNEENCPTRIFYQE